MNHYSNKLPSQKGRIDTWSNTPTIHLHPVRSRSVEKFPQHLQRFQHRKVGQMKTIIVIEHGEAARPLLTVHGKEVHGVVIHPHQGDQARGFVRIDVEAVLLRRQRRKTGVQKVETGTGGIFLQIGVKSQKSRQTHQKDQVEIGIALLTGIQPADGMTQVGKQGRILQLFVNGPVEEFTQKKGDGRFAGIERDADKGLKQLGLGHGVERLMGAHFKNQLYQRKGLKQRGPDAEFPVARYLDDKGRPTQGFCIDVGKQGRIFVFQGAKHNAGGGLQHRFCLF